MRFPSPVFLFGFSLYRRILLYSVFVFLVLFFKKKKNILRSEGVSRGQSFATCGRFFRQFIRCVKPISETFLWKTMWKMWIYSVENR